MPTAPRPKVYTVGNPHGAPKGIAILEYADDCDSHGNIVKAHPYRGKWFEGDDFMPPPSMTAEMIKRRIQSGFLIPKE